MLDIDTKTFPHSANLSPDLIHSSDAKRLYLSRSGVFLAPSKL